MIEKPYNNGLEKHENNSKHNKTDIVTTKHWISEISHKIQTTTLDIDEKRFKNNIDRDNHFKNEIRQVDSENTIPKIKKVQNTKKYHASRFASRCFSSNSQ